MISKSKIKQGYVGPRALFDPQYIPPALLHRKKEEFALLKILIDSIKDDFNLNVLYQGMNGIGKKAITNKVLRDLTFSNKDLGKILCISVDCKKKKTDEILISLIEELNNYSRYKVDLSILFKGTLLKLSKLWTIIKLIIKKLNINSYMILTLNNAESMDSDALKKFLSFGKDADITVIYTVNKILRSSTLNTLSEFDYKKRLDYFQYKELYDILEQRTNLSFKQGIDKELIEFVTDLIFEHYIPVPGKGIEFFRELYPYMQKSGSIEYYETLEICQNQFENEVDEFSLVNYISEEDLLTIIFLDNLSNHFINKSNFYIIPEELREIYDVACESLEYDKNTREFNKIVQMSQNIGILSPSKKTFDHEHFFMAFDPSTLKTMIDTVFGNT